MPHLCCPGPWQTWCVARPFGLGGPSRTCATGPHPRQSSHTSDRPSCKCILAQSHIPLQSLRLSSHASKTLWHMSWLSPPYRTDISGIWSAPYSLSAFLSHAHWTCNYLPVPATWGALCLSISHGPTPFWMTHHQNGYTRFHSSLVSKVGKSGVLFVLPVRPSTLGGGCTAHLILTAWLQVRFQTWTSARHQPVWASFTQTLRPVASRDYSQNPCYPPIPWETPLDPSSWASPWQQAMWPPGQQKNFSSSCSAWSALL